jgi:type II secretory pathway pseudopilin PulG
MPKSADAKEMRRQGELAFTMVEIAISIGVIGFALVAIIGILPTGMNKQKDNREDTLVSQDAPYFLDAIRNGAVVNYGILPSNSPAAQGLDYLTNYVQSIRFDYLVGGVTNSTNIYSNFYSGAQIIGLLSTPQTNYNSPFFDSNYFDVTATVRALSGPAAEQQNGSKSALSSFMAFTYRMEVMVVPFNSFAPYTTNFTNPNLDAYQSNVCYNRWIEATPGLSSPIANPTTALPPYPSYSTYFPIAPATGALAFNLFDVRLRFSWPVFQNGNVGPGRQTYRSLVASQLTEAPLLINGVTVPGWFFQPQTYTNVYPNGL